MSTLLIWDKDGAPPAGPWTTVLWRAFSCAAVPDAISIPRAVETHAHELRAQYFAWVYDLGETRIRGRRLVDHLELKPGFSYWWMTGIAHTPNFYEAPYISDAVKCLAFERITAPIDGVVRIVLHTARPPLAEVFAEYCRRRGIRFEHERGSETESAANHGGLLAPVRALALLALLTSRSLFAFGRGERRWLPQTSSRLCVFDVLIHLKPAALAGGAYESSYWQALVRALADARVAVTWVHTFFAHADVPAIGRARELVNRFTEASDRLHRHGLIDSQLTLRGALSALGSYLRLVKTLLTLTDVREHFQPHGSTFDFWPLLRGNWRGSLSGAGTMRNCAWLSMYEQALSSMPRQETGVYILENQPWEMALLHAWRAAGHGRIIGVPHATVRFWDLRYHYDPRTYSTTGRNDLPRPDLVAVNGPAALKEYRDAGYPEDEIREVESLRYMHLQRAGVAPRTDTPGGQLRVLICGDNIPGSNARLMDVVAAAAAMLPARPSFIFKPHKAAPFDPAPYAALQVTVTGAELTRLIEECDLVITGNMTSAAVDAYVMGRCVASQVDGSMMNSSPFRGFDGVVPFETAAELADIIRATPGGTVQTRAPQPFFHLDDRLPRWRRLLGLPLPAGRHETAPEVRGDARPPLAATAANA